jgi:putative salt-induced outer membrane protein YdiY
MHNYLSGYVFFFILFCSVTTSAEIIKLKNGDSINIVVKDETDSQLTVEHQSLGKLIILREQIISIHHEREELPVEDIVTFPTADRGMFYTGLLKGWERRFEFGLDGSAGNSQNETLRSTLNLKYEDDDTRSHFEMLYYVSRDDKESSENKAYANFMKDWLIKDSKWFVFSNSGIDWDQFKDWDYRLRQYAGPGYQFIKTEKLNVRGRMGLGAKKIFGDRSDETTIELPLGFEVATNINENHKIECSNMLYPSLSNKGEYRNVSNLNWYIKFNYYSSFGLKVGLFNEYDTLLSSKNDTDYYVSIIWDF